MTGGADHTPGRSARCVVWHAKGRGLDPDLSRALAKRPEFEVVRCESEFAAMAEVCRDRDRPTVLLLVEPEQLSEREDVLRLLPVYAPATRTWRFDAAASPSLRAVTPEGRGREASEGTSGAGHRGPEAPVASPLIEGVIGTSRVKVAPPPPRLRLAGEGPARQSSAGEVKPARAGAANAGTGEPELPSEASEPADASRLLSEEELAMLLSTDETAGQPPRDG